MPIVNLLATLLLAQPAEVLSAKFDVFDNEVRVGKAELTDKPLDTGGRQVLILMDLSANNRTSKVRQETVYDAKGRQTRMIMDVATGSGDRTQFLVQIVAGKATVNLTQGGKTTTTTVEASKEAPLENPSVFWFRGITPAKGTKAVFYQFSINEMRWNLTETSYIGETEKGHVMKMTKGQAILDKKGLPLLIEADRMRMQRSKI